jgi:hypothetical protein
MEELTIYGGIILKWILKNKFGVRVWNGFGCLMIPTSVGLM